MISTGFTLAVLTGIAFYFIFLKLPRRVKKFLQQHALLTDAIACFLAYMLFGGTIVALFAAAFLGVIVSIILALTANPSTNAVMESIGQKCGEIKDKFLAWMEANVGERTVKTDDTIEAEYEEVTVGK